MCSWGLIYVSRPENAGEQHVSTAPKQNRTGNIFLTHTSSKDTSSELTALNLQTIPFDLERMSLSLNYSLNIPSLLKSPQIIAITEF